MLWVSFLSHEFKDEGWYCAENDFVSMLENLPRNLVKFVLIDNCAPFANKVFDAIVFLAWRIPPRFIQQ